MVAAKFEIGFLFNAFVHRIPAISYKTLYSFLVETGLATHTAICEHCIAAVLPRSGNGISSAPLIPVNRALSECDSMTIIAYIKRSQFFGLSSIRALIVTFSEGEEFSGCCCEMPVQR